ncbi:acetate--CoA ligase family protein [Halofilum ochraceum]|uniref:acetate--CoA ligase family protein n=1 Tax=Halofilum ochraceum TaxID=1611323 RepID=UPI0008DA12AD|nr:acetate--CoA ligase family protein [Halofilum ochraceum]
MEAVDATGAGERADLRRRNLGRLLRPRQIAVIGGAAAVETVRQLDHIGFQGDIWPVNPKRESMEGRPCYASVADLPTGPDAAVVAVPAAHCPEVFAALNARGAGGGICFAAGFAEDGIADLEKRLVEAAGDVALVGPNCHGIINCLDRVALWPDDHGADPAESGFALISQSGNVALSATFQQRSAPFGYVIGTGNQAQLGVEDFIEALLDDPRIHAIGLFVEGLRDVGRFARAARRALGAGKPIVAIKVGASAEGARASQSHTAALTGSDSVYDALFDRLGIRRAGSLAELIETLKLFSVTGPLHGNEVISLSCSGGEAALMGDRLSAAGLTCPPPQPVQRIADAFRIQPTSVGNPLDYNTRIWGDTEAAAAGFETVLGDRYDAAILVLDFPPTGRARPDNWRSALDGFLLAQGRTGAPATVLSTLPEALPASAREACLAAGVTPLQGLDEGIRALAHGANWTKRRTALLEQPAWDGPLAAAPSITAAQSLDEAESKRRLAQYGLRIPRGRTTDRAGLADAAESLEYPLVLKAVGRDIGHKTELGAVALGIADQDQLLASAEAMATRLRAAGHAGKRWLVEEAVPDAVAELIVGVVRDPVAGPVLVVGSGGILAELVRDTRTLLLPAEQSDIRRAIESLAVGRVLAGYRGREGGDIDAAVEACAAIGRFTEAHADGIAELDVNPLLVRPAGLGAVAADALVRLVDPEPPAPEST